MQIEFFAYQLKQSVILFQCVIIITNDGILYWYVHKKRLLNKKMLKNQTNNFSRKKKEFIKDKYC